MRIKSATILAIALLIISSFLIFQNFVLAISAPTVTFTGDDILQNGGTDDAYDALIAINITAAQASPAAWELQYSTNAGQDWDDVLANYTAVTSQNRYYYWSTTGIFAPSLLFRARTQHGEEWSEYFQASLKLSHRLTNHNAHYFIESFNTTDDLGAISSGYINWDTNRALVELGRSGPNPPPPYHPDGTVTSLDVLRGISNNNVLAVTFQPVQWDFARTLEYQVSNNGSDWYGPQLNAWFSFADQAVPDPVTVQFSSAGNGLFWRMHLNSTAPQISPQAFQLRFNWQENTPPQACFTINPTGSNDPDEEYLFNANCSSDYEDALNDLDFKWDFDYEGEGDVSWDTDWLQGNYSRSHIFNSTSTITIRLGVRDTFNEEDTFLNSINEEGVEGAIYGWLWTSNYGWTSLNCDNSYYGELINFCPPNYGWQMNADYTMSGWAWDANIGWLCLGSSCQLYGQTPDEADSTAVYSRASGEVVGWGRYPVFGENGWLQLRGNWCDGGEEGDQCVHVNLSRRALNGWGWSAGVDESGAPVGVGWVQFEGNVNVPWLETKYGSIYGRGNVGSADTASAPEGRYNASYCILSSGDIINLTSESGCLGAAYRDLNFPHLSEKYRTITGIIDFERILNGEEITYESQDVDANLPGSLAGKVYNFSGDGLNSFTIDQPITFYHARNFNSSGAGTIVIDGDLYINSNLYYEGSPVRSQIENLASVAWIVKGDLIIAPSVSQVAGAFIVLGREGVACPNNGCGHFKTGDDSDNPCQLVVQGLAMARQFTFERYFKQAGEPAEKIIYDGRVLINTPPGLEEIAKGLPIWREAYATLEIE